ncbi:MAG: GFA family protein, partial [Aestuariivirga sp.]
CPDCGCVVCWRAMEPDTDGRRRIAVNLRLAEPEAVAAIVIDHFDGLERFDDLPRDGRCVADMWF